LKQQKLNYNKSTKYKAIKFQVWWGKRNGGRLPRKGLTWNHNPFSLLRVHPYTFKSNHRNIHCRYGTAHLMGDYDALKSQWKQPCCNTISNSAKY